jgi:hypothetical protein
MRYLTLIEVLDLYLQIMSPLAGKCCFAGFNSPVWVETVVTTP